MPTTTNFLMTLVDLAQSTKEAAINAALTILDDGAFVRRGTLAARPAASRAGRLYWATDSGNEGLYRDTGAAWESLLSGGVHLNFGGGTIVTAVAGANAGGSPPAPVVIAGSNDVRGFITWGSGTAPSAGPQVVVTFAVPYAVAPQVFLTPRGGATTNIGPNHGGSTTGGFTIATAGTPAASQGNGVYSASYFVVP